MRCIILEDQPPAQRLLRRYVEQTEGLQHTGTYADPMVAAQQLRKQDTDLLFLDIHLPKVNGLDLLRLLERPPHVILTTAYDRYALQGYELNVVDYLLKPIAYERFLAAVAKVPGGEAAAVAGTHDNIQFVKSGHAYVRVDIGQLQYIRSDGDYTELYEAEQRHLSVHTLRYWEQVGGGQFLRIHRSYLVHLPHISRLYGNRVVLQDGTELPIGRAYREVIKRRLLG